MKFFLSIFLFIYALGLFAQDINHRKICDLPLEVKESSGLAIVAKDKIWTHNDAGYQNELFLVDSNGNLLRTVVVENVTNHDWEDLALDAEGNLWINDAGNNSNARNNLKLYRLNKNDLANNDYVNADRIINFSYPDQNAFPPSNKNMNFDIEAMVHHRDSLYLFTKNRSNPTTGYTKIYSLPSTPGTYTANLVDSFFVEPDLMRSRITAADFDPNTNQLALLTRTQVIVFANFGEGSMFQGDVTRYFFKNRTEKVEALGFVDANTFYMTDEGSPNNNVPGKWYEIKKILPNGLPNLQLFDAVVYYHQSAQELNVILDGEYQVELIDVKGQSLLHYSENDASSRFINFSSPKILIVRIQQNKKVFQIKIII